MLTAIATSVVVTILTTNVADTIGQGEWSFAAWVEADGRSFLFDTGWSPENVRDNAEALGIDLSRAEDLILSHNHGDHTGGLETLRRELSERNPKALTRIHVAEGIFSSRPGTTGERNPMVALKSTLESLGSTFIVHDRPSEIAPGVWLTGPVPRKYDEKNYPTGPESLLKKGDTTLPDDIPESQSLVIVTADGPILVAGCGHAGLINTLEHVQANVSKASPQAAIGGFHLYNASESVLQFTSDKLRSMQLRYFLGSHCTGFESTYRIRELAGMDRDHAIVGAIGTRFISGQGILPGNINR
ncbi:MAG TPA: MBL fold metallo-hydrolase [Vicinamibacteria bacterium]|nr:MBL fold metallo-hydrolase [Vicinamibacteria bacterium]